MVSNMSNFNNNQKVNKYLDELSNEYKVLLLEKLLEHTSDMENISISELIRIDTKIKEPLRGNKDRALRKQKLLIMIGLVYTTLGILIYIFLNLEQKGLEGVSSLFSILISYMGVLIIFTAFIKPYFNTNKLHDKSMNKINNKLDDKVLEYEVIITWRELEGIANDLNSNWEMNPVLSGQIIQMLVYEGLITNQESDSLRKLLKLRNSIVHSSQFSFSRQELTDLLNESKSIIEKLRKIL